MVAGGSATRLTLGNHRRSGVADPVVILVPGRSCQCQSGSPSRMSAVGVVTVAAVAGVAGDIGPASAGMLASAVEAGLG